MPFGKICMCCTTVHKVHFCVVLTKGKGSVQTNTTAGLASSSFPADLRLENAGQADMKELFCGACLPRSLVVAPGQTNSHMSTSRLPLKFMLMAGTRCNTCEWTNGAQDELQLLMGTTQSVQVGQTRYSCSKMKIVIKSYLEWPFPDPQHFVPTAEQHRIDAGTHQR